MSASTVTAAALTALLHNVPYRVKVGDLELNPLTRPPAVESTAHVSQFLACNPDGTTEPAAVTAKETIRISICTGHLLAAAELLAQLESGIIGPDVTQDPLILTPWESDLPVPKLTFTDARLQPEWKFHPGANGAPDSCELTWICRRASSGAPMIRWEM